MIMRKRMIIALLAVTLLVVWTAYPDDVAQLRAGGQLAVDDLHAQWTAAPPERREELQDVLDRVCGQKDCHTSRLFWYTDLEEAKAVAHRLGKPILSLQLLGRLDEELSCANSRFFRTLLYPDPAIAAILRDRFVLHWHSVRDVPRITIDLGGGRVIRQTITGNSAHYLMSADGRVLDALPGLYSPQAFRAQLEQWVTIYPNVVSSPDALQAYHQTQYEEAMLRGNALGVPALMLSVASSEVLIAATARAQSKMAVERPIMSKLQPGAQRVFARMAGNRAQKKGSRRDAIVAQSAELPRVSEVAAERDVWRRIGDQEKDQVRFSDGALQLMASKQPLTDELLDNLKQNVATDTAFNEYDLHVRIHEWFVRGEVTSLDAFTERLYAELFLTPSSDPWLGLKEPSVFTAIGGNS
jgi:hypothetical protein